MRRKTRVLAPIINVQLVRRGPRNRLDAIGDKDLLTECTIDVRVAPWTGVALLLFDPLVAIRSLAESDGPGGLSIDMKHDIIPFLWAALQAHLRRAINRSE